MHWPVLMTFHVSDRKDKLQELSDGAVDFAIDIIVIFNGLIGKGW